MSKANDLDPLHFFEEELKDPSVQVQLNAAKDLKVILKALGPQRSAQELIPLLDKYCFPVPGLIQAAADPAAYGDINALMAKEEVLAEIASQLDDEAVPLVGGSMLCAKWILPLLEKLAMVEETVIRENAAAAISKCVGVMNPMDVKQNALGVLMRLAA